LQTRKVGRANYWRSFIAKEVAIVLAIAWYIKVELLRTKQLPQYITYTGIDRVPRLKGEIQKQATNVYENLYRKGDIVNKFFIADTGQNHLNGRVGMISSYDTVNCRFVVKVGTSNQRTTSESTEMLLPPENMEPYTWFRGARHAPRPSAETYTITLTNHFAVPVGASPTVTFHSDVFSDIGGITGSPHMGGQAQQDRLIQLIETKEAIAKRKRRRYRHNKWSWKRACQGYIHRVFLLKADLEKKSDKFMKCKMNKESCRSSPERYRSNLYGRQKLNISFQKTASIKEMTAVIKMNLSTCLHIHSEQLIILCTGHAKVWLNSVITQEKTVSMMPYMGGTTLHLLSLLTKNLLALLLLDMTWTMT